MGEMVSLQRDKKKMAHEYTGKARQLFKLFQRLFLSPNQEHVNHRSSKYILVHQSDITVLQRRSGHRCNELIVAPFKIAFPQELSRQDHKK
jgi:predicted P-loop ATPase/GTPase